MNCLIVEIQSQVAEASVANDFKPESILRRGVVAVSIMDVQAF